MRKITYIFNSLIVLSLLFFIIYLSVWSRLATLKSPTVLDYDPWWHYRHSKAILDNNLQIPKWDLLSFYPPGRPAEKFQGWEYTMVIFHKIISFFKDIPFMETAKWSPVIMVGLTVIPAFLLGQLLVNKWAGFIAAIFATLTPTFMGVSMAGYCDTDAVVVFYFFLSIYSILLALKKKSILYYIFAVIANLAFISNWGAGWFPSIFLLFFIPTLFIFRIIEEIIHQKKLKVDVKKIVKKAKPLLISIIIILVATNIIGYLLGFSNMIKVFFVGLGFFGFGGGQKMLVGVSVAELQIINIFSKAGFSAVVSRVGLAPTLFTLIGLPLFILFKLYKKIKIHYTEIFLCLWIATTFYLILHGVRFALLFSTATAISAAYVIGNLIKYLKRDLIGATVLGFITILIIMFVSEAIQAGYGLTGMQISKNWYEMLDWLKENADEKSLVTTWWDPGHIIAGYTGLRVHADGAHCPPDLCIPYNHNVRIQDMGKIMSTSDEEEAVSILKKYKQLTPEQQQEVKQKYGNKVPEEAFEPVSDIYFISSNDLIGKFTWMNYFGGYKAPISSNYDFARNPGVCCAATPKTPEGQISCGEFADQGKGVWIWCPWIFSLKDVQQDQEGNPVYVYDYSGLTITLIQKNNILIPIYNNQFVINHLTFFPEGQPQDQNLSNLNTTLEKIDGLIWLDPGFTTLIYFTPAIRNSIFTRTFFYEGQGLEHFELVFSNPEIKLYKVNF